MSELTMEPVEPFADRVAPARPVWVWWPLALALVALAAAALFWAMADSTPSDDSLEAGFARDMMVHHDQAVMMAQLIRDRTTDPAIKALATDIILSQTNQIGQMMGWLNAWGLPATGTLPAMTWMGEPTNGMMPGMATPQEIADLQRLSGEAADAEFLRLMIRHHQGAIPMAQMALQASDNAVVRTLAQQIITAQETEVANMEAMLAEKSGDDAS